MAENKMMDAITGMKLVADMKPVNIRRLAEIRGVSEGTVRYAIKTNKLPEPIQMEGSKGASHGFFLWGQVKSWKA